MDRSGRPGWPTFYWVSIFGSCALIGVGVVPVFHWLHARPDAMPPGGVCSPGGIALAPDSNFPVKGFGHGSNECVCSVLNTASAASYDVLEPLWLPNSSMTTRASVPASTIPLCQVSNMRATGSVIGSTRDQPIVDGRGRFH